MSRTQYISRTDAHEAAVSWRSSLLFMKDEARFFRDLLDKYFEALISQSRMEESRKLIDELNDWSIKDLDYLLQLCQDLENRIAAEETDPDIATRNLVVELSDNMNKLEEHFRALKKRIFEIVEEIRLSEKS